MAILPSQPLVSVMLPTCERASLVGQAIAAVPPHTYPAQEALLGTAVPVLSLHIEPQFHTS